MGSVHDAVAARLAPTGTRYTPSRRRLVDLLAAAGQPLAVSEILDRTGDLPRGTVYRNLAVLQETAIVRAIAGHDEFTRFELDEELTGHHHHLACVTCGALADFALASDVEERISAEILRAARETGFAADAHRIDILGRCSNCQNG